MAGTSETSYWEQDGMYLSQTVGATAITLGTVVEIGSTDGYVITASSASTKALGVAIAGYRTSRTATDNAVAAGGLVTVATRGAYIATAGDAVSGGVGVYPVSGTVQYVASVPISISYSGTQIGRALTAASSGTNNFALVNFAF